jgi:hypothetical protein
LTTIGLGSTQTGKIHHPPGVPGLRHEVTENSNRQEENVAGFLIPEYQNLKSRNGSWEQYQEKEEEIPFLLPLHVFLQEAVAFIFSTCNRVEKLTPHSLQIWQVISVSLCLEPGTPGGW